MVLTLAQDWGPSFICFGWDFCGEGSRRRRRRKRWSPQFWYAVPDSSSSVHHCLEGGQLPLPFYHINHPYHQLSGPWDKVRKARIDLGCHQQLVNTLNISRPRAAQHKHQPVCVPRNYCHPGHAILFIVPGWRSAPPLLRYTSSAFVILRCCYCYLLLILCLWYPYIIHILWCCTTGLWQDPGAPKDDSLRLEGHSSW